jgi:hypothetical protein
MNLAALCPTPAVFADSGDNLKPTGLAFNRTAEAKIEKILDVARAAYLEATGVDFDLTKLPRNRQRLLAGMVENVVAHHRTAVASGNRGALLNLNAEARNAFRGLSETVVSADIATFTTQQIAFVVDVFAPFIMQDVVTTAVMTGPTAYIHRQRFTREDNAGDFAYGANSALTDGLDPGYSECPTECGAANGIDIEITAELVEADCRRLAGTYCSPANYHFSSQYGGDLGNVLMEGMTLELRRATQADVITDMLANAGGTHTWNRTPAVDSYFETANPNEWKRELWNTIREANREILKATDGGRVSADLVLGDVDGIGVLEDAVPMQLADEQPGDVSSARGDEMTAFFGTTKQGRYSVYRFLEGMPDDTLIVTARNDRDPTYVYAPWIPITNLGMWTNPETAQTKLGAMTLYGKAAIRPKRIRRINIGA